MGRFESLEVKFENASRLQTLKARPSWPVRAGPRAQPRLLAYSRGGEAASSGRQLEEAQIADMTTRAAGVYGTGARCARPGTIAVAHRDGGHVASSGGSARRLCGNLELKFNYDWVRSQIRVALVRVVSPSVVTASRISSSVASVSLQNAHARKFSSS